LYPVVRAGKRGVAFFEENTSEARRDNEITAFLCDVLWGFENAIKEKGLDAFKIQYKNCVIKKRFC